MYKKINGETIKLRESPKALATTYREEILFNTDRETCQHSKNVKDVTMDNPQLSPTFKKLKFSMINI